MEVKQRIIKKSCDEYCKYGVRSVTMDELSLSLGMSKRTIYETFHDKKELVSEVTQYFNSVMKEKTENAIQSSPNVIAGVTSALRLFIEVSKTVNPLFFKDLKKYYPEAAKIIYAKNSVESFEVTNKLLSTGQEQGVFRKDLNAQLVSLFINKILFSIPENVEGIENIKYGDFEKDVLFAYLIGIATKEGGKLIIEEQEKYLSELPKVAILGL